VFGKTDFVLEVLRGAGLNEAQLTSIERVNRRALRRMCTRTRWKESAGNLSPSCGAPRRGASLLRRVAALEQFRTRGIGTVD
jgi:hypothetical protein